jgi:tetratricopeptide (TPR) repeat protein
MYERLLQALRDDLVENAEQRPDALMVTGDVSLRGTREDFIAARRWLVETARALGLGPERIFVVPGNHDVERDASARNEGLELRLLADLREGRRRLDLALEKPAARNLLAARLAPFCEFAFAFGPGTAPPAERLEWSHVVPGREGLEVRLVGLCTPWLSMDDGDRGELRLGTAPLDRALATFAPGELVVALSHHPVRGGWLADEATAEAWMTANAHVHLTGQVHDPSAEAARGGTAGPCVWIAAGATPAPPNQPEARRRLGWSLVQVMRGADGAATLRIAPRRWSTDLKRFTADDEVLRGGHSFVDRPLRLVLPPPTVKRALSSAPPPMRPSVPAPALTVRMRTVHPPPFPAEPARPPATLDGPPPAPTTRIVPPPGRGFPSSPPPAPTTRMSSVPPPPGGIRMPAPMPNPRTTAPVAVPGFRTRLGADAPPAAVQAAPAPASPAGSPPTAAETASIPRTSTLVSTGTGPSKGTGLRGLAAPPPAHSPWGPTPDLRSPWGAAPDPEDRPSSDGAPPSSGRSVPPSFMSAGVHKAQALFEGPGALPVMPVPFFVGRTNELATLRQTLVEGGVTCVVATGLGGVGKTSLVQHFVATEARALFDESAWIDARDLPGELGRVAKRFGWRHEDRSPTVEEAGAFLREALDPRRVLVVIDNVDPGMAAVRAFPVPALSSKSRLVVTSRIVTLHEDLGRLSRPLRLGTWDDATCRAHFREVVPSLIQTPDEDLDRLARRVGGLPLAVRLIAKQLLRPGNTARSLAARLERDPLEALDSAARGAERTVVATFQSALAGLGDAERRVLLALGACAPATRAEVVAAVAGVREEDAAMALEGLAEQSLVEWLPDAEQPFRLHDVVRLLLATLPGAADAEAAHDAWALARAAEHAAPAAWQALDREVPEVLAVVDHRLRHGDGAGAWQALFPVLGALDRRGMYGELVSAATRVLAAVPEDSNEAASVLGHLGQAWYSLGEIAKATTTFERALTISEARRWPEGQGLALAGLGRCQAVRGAWAEAIAFHQRAANIHEMIGERRAFADDLGNVGLALRHVGDVSRAIEHLERAMAIHEDLLSWDGLAEVLGGLGLCFRDIGEPKSAIEYFGRALEIHEAQGRSVGQATMLGNLGNTFRTVGDVPAAISHLERALAIYERLGLLEGQGAALGNLGNCYKRTDKPKARDYFERSLAVLRRVGLPDDHPHVRMVLGTLAKMDGRPLGPAGPKAG